jgi:hypothetical protein
MNRRTLKKHCDRARRVLIAEHGYKPADFERAKGEESVDAPPAMERRFVTGFGFLDPGPLKGTWLLWEKCDYYSNDWDCKLPLEHLREIELWAGMSDADFAKLCEEA